MDNKIERINKKIELENNQVAITKKAWYLAGFFLLIIIIAFFEIIDIHPSFIMLSIFFFVTSTIVGFISRSRKKKLKNLIDGNTLIASWKLSNKQKGKYVKNMFIEEAGKNMFVLFSISFIAIIIFGLFILFIPKGKLAMLGVLIGLIIFLALFAFGMPYYYRYKNNKGDGIILIGKKYAYINGFFHNWDFPLSGIKNVKVIKKPFYGIELTYYYTDRTLTHTEKIIIPANRDVDLEEILNQLID